MSSVTVPFVDYAAYSGRWYTVAKIPFKWDTGCSCSYADYTFNGVHLCVVNTCVFPNGKSYSRSGTAVIPQHVEPGKLMIHFTDQVVQTQGAVKISRAGDYYIHYTDYTRYAVVGSSTGDNLWILSRSQATPPVTDLQKLRAFIVDLGYDESKVVFEERIKVPTDKK